MNQRSYLILVLCCLILTEAGAWTKTILADSHLAFGPEGFPITDEYGDTYPSVPSAYAPSVQVSSNGLQVLRIEGFQEAPGYIDEIGFPILDDYFRLNYGTLSGGGWQISDMLTDYLTDIQNPALVSRLDEGLSFAYRKDNLLTIETIGSPENTRVTLPLSDDKWSIAIDENDGIHLLRINSNYELWHAYFDGETLSQLKLSDGPISNVVAHAGENNGCHVLYASFSEDTNDNEALDDGEDLNGNSVLDQTPYQLLYQSIDGATASTADSVVDDTILRLNHFDLLYSQTYGLSLVYSDPVRNSVRFAAGGVSAWTIRSISSVNQLYADVRLAQKSSGDCAVSYVPEDGSGLYVSEETAGSWTESLIDQSTIGAYFRGTDLAYDENSNLVVLASEKDPAYLTAYSRVSLPSIMATLVKPISIRGAFIVTWPTPSEEATSQLLQKTSDLSDPDSWTTIEQRNFSISSERETAETIVERSSPSVFYRVVEVSD